MALHKHTHYITFLLAFFLWAQLTAQTCRVPFALSFSDRTTTAIKVRWSDININPMGWEFELVEKGRPRKEIPTTPLIVETEYVFTNLKPSTAYELYIRTACSMTSSSSWNVAIPFTTVLAIPTECGVNIPLKDNGTETLLLDIPEKGILGKDVFLLAVDLIAEHDWPADLKIILETPQGQQLVLSNHNGTVTDDFGDINDTTCNKVTTFSPDACQELRNSKPPYIGIFKPDGDIEALALDTLSKGYWKLIFFDRALKDAGILHYFNVRFSQKKCLIPQNFLITSSNLTSISVSWKGTDICNTVKISVKKDGQLQDPVFVECTDNKYTFHQLSPNTNYEFSILSICEFSSQSNESCFIKGSTTCESVSFAESFDTYSICNAGCAVECAMQSPNWFNVKDDGPQDWILWRGKTDTDNTGPAGDVKGDLQYVYIENNPELCGNANTVILQSSCLDVKSNPSECDMSFYYHMYGVDIMSLKLLISLDDGNIWEEIFMVNGDQGDQWNRATLSLKKFDKNRAIFRFVGASSHGILGDIALDQITFYKSTVSSGLSSYYPDEDGDGYGSEAGKIQICASTPPMGYSAKAGDCDDLKATIHPDATEIPCNAIDENCNGNTDDSPDFNPIKIIPVLTNPSCNGSADGRINITLSGGTLPYSIKWNNGKMGPSIDSLSAGVYFAEVRDNGGCILKSEFFQINAVTSLTVIPTEIIAATCQGKSDGRINIAHNKDNPPYKYKWSNGTTNEILLSIPEGKYGVTVTDKSGCFAVLEEISVASKSAIVTNIKGIKQPLCAGQNTGSIELITVNGQTPYTYSWNTGRTTAKIDSLSPAKYLCTITDQNGCVNTFETDIIRPDSIKIDVLSAENVRCFGESNGSIKTKISGGKAPYTFLWNNFDFSDDVFNLKAGNYQLTVTDANGCRLNSPMINIKEPLVFELVTDSLMAASCIFGQNGSIKLSTKGGNDGNNFAWKHTDLSTPKLDNLGVGTYSVTAYDKLGCKSTIANISIPYINIPVDISIS
ncbi:MAG: fibronectin type III domain-containing protein, partial [Saprospiraceae bacterium]